MHFRHIPLARTVFALALGALAFVGYAEAVEPAKASATLEDARFVEVTLSLPNAQGIIGVAPAGSSEVIEFKNEETGHGLRFAPAANLAHVDVFLTQQDAQGPDTLLRQLPMDTDFTFSDAELGSGFGGSVTGRVEQRVEPSTAAQTHPAFSGRLVKFQVRTPEGNRATLGSLEGQISTIKNAKTDTILGFIPVMNEDTDNVAIQVFLMENEETTVEALDKIAVLSLGTGATGSFEQDGIYEVKVLDVTRLDRHLLDSSRRSPGRSSR